ncbi:hypothetical protein EMIT079MI2_170114 [Bacillus sp. IT-79MI2]
MRNGLVLHQLLWIPFIGSLVFLLFIKFMIGFLRTISSYKFMNGVLSEMKCLTLFCMFIKVNASANGSIASCILIKQNKLTVYFIWVIIQKV